MERHPINRRTFLTASLVSGLTSQATLGSQAKRRVAVLGHTGRGNYGHSLDTVWQKIPEAEIVAVADADEAGLSRELKLLGIERGYTSYRTMLAEVQPEFVSVAPRHADQHYDMALAAIEAGVKGLYVEKPFCRTPAEADSLIAACQRYGAKIAVAHRNRYHPALVPIKAMIDQGQLGRLLELRGRGKGDRRGGGEDLWVLGCHVMNLFQHFAGEPRSCSAVMLQDGRRVEAKDIRPGNEGLGPLAANEVHARYLMENGVVARYDSIANDGTAGNSFCLQIVGSSGMVAIHLDADPLAHFLAGNPYAVSEKPHQWIPITSAGPGQPEPTPELVTQVRNHIAAVRDLIEAVDANRQPLCDASAGATTVEMICAVFESHRRNSQTVNFPLSERDNALLRL